MVKILRVEKPVSYSQLKSENRASKMNTEEEKVKADQKNQGEERRFENAEERIETVVNFRAPHVCQ
jgi:hypothetical protein